VFKTPYKAGGVQDQKSEAGSVKQKGTKMQSTTPIYIPKAVAKSKAFLNRNLPLAISVVAQSENGEKHSRIENEGNSRNDSEIVAMIQESRKHQDEIIQKKEKTVVKPTVGRLFEMKNQKSRFKLRDVIDLSQKSPSEMEVCITKHLN